jgi:predicted lipase
MYVPRIIVGVEDAPVPRRFTADTVTEIGPKRLHLEDDMSKKWVQSPSTQETEGSTVSEAHIVIVLLEAPSKYSIMYDVAEPSIFSVILNAACMEEKQESWYTIV